MPLSNAEKVRRHRERKKAEVAARERYDRGLPEPPPEPEPPEGAYLTSSGVPRPKFMHYEAKDGTFPPVPDALVAETFTTEDGETKRYEEHQLKALARRREGSATSDDRSILSEG
jgi:hypothetical protein